MTDAVDILPCGFKIERTLSLTNLLGKPKTETFQCKTRWLDNRMQYGVKTSGNDDFPADCWADSPSAAFNEFRDREKLSKTKVISGPFLFGYPCFAVQQHLYMMRQSQAIEGPMKKKQRGGMAKLRLKQVVMDLIKSKDVQDKLAKARKEKAVAFRAEMFAYDATQKVVQRMLHQLESCLIEGRSPLERAQQVLSQLINHPDIKLILHSIAAAHWQVDSKQLLVIDHILVQLKLAISVRLAALVRCCVCMCVCVCVCVWVTGPILFLCVGAQEPTISRISRSLPNIDEHMLPTARSQIDACGGCAAWSAEPTRSHCRWNARGSAASCVRRGCRCNRLGQRR